MSVFETLNGLNVNEHTEKKKAGNVELTYLSWPWAWAEVKRRYPDAHYEVWKDEKGLPYTFSPETGFMVYTKVCIEGVEHEMWLPVMDGANNAMKAVPYDYTVKNPNFKYAKWDAEKKGYYDKYGNKQDENITKHVNPATMFDINKTIMRCLVKNLAMFGLGLYIYAGEDLPEGESQTPEAQKEQPKAQKAEVTASTKVPPKAELSPEMAFLNNELSFMAQETGSTMDGMKAAYMVSIKAMVKAKLIPDKKVSEYTKYEIETILDYMRKSRKAS